MHDVTQEVNFRVGFKLRSLHASSSLPLFHPPLSLLACQPVSLPLVIYQAVEIKRQLPRGPNLSSEGSWRHGMGTVTHLSGGPSDAGGITARICGVSGLTNKKR